MWFSVMLLRRGIAMAMIQQAITPLLSIWALMWPVYVDKRWLWSELLLLFVLAILCSQLRSPFWQQLRQIWSAGFNHPAPPMHARIPLLPLTHLLLGLGISGLWFQYIPEFGFGLALCLCLAFPAAFWVDHPAIHRQKLLRLGFPAHPEQTLGSHLVLIIASTALLSWSLHVYHGTAWQSLFIATLITALVASLCRALVPGQWNMPAAILSMGFVMSLL